jgi:DNA-binding Lrp family transcriptional regulator
VHSQVQHIDGVTEAHVVAGAYDLVVEMDSENVTNLLDAVSSELGNVEGVGTTRTYIALA